MSKHETPITRWYWQKLGGLLCEEFCLIDGGDACGRRLADAVVLPERETRVAARSEQISIRAGERAVVLQTKRGRLGMYLMGQTLFSAELLRRRFPSAVIESVALCTSDDEVLRPMLEAHNECLVVVVPGEVALTKTDGAEEPALDAARGPIDERAVRRRRAGHTPGSSWPD